MILVTMTYSTPILMKIPRLTQNKALLALMRRKKSLMTTWLKRPTKCNKRNTNPWYKIVKELPARFQKMTSL